jgi:DNA replication and repair protein RecF
MPLTSLRVVNFRNLAKVELDPLAQGLTILSGDNGSGKTSLLEAIYYLGLGRSFRTGTASRLIRHQTDKFSIFSQLLSESERLIPVGVERSVNGSTRLRMAEKDMSSLAELAFFIPIRLINSQSHHFFESGPSFRRQFLDWGLFYQDPGFLPCWRQFERVLKQRNALLREKRTKRELDAWTQELVSIGLVLDEWRRAYVETLSPWVKDMARELLSVASLELHYRSGWSQDRDYAEVLAHAYAEEWRQGHTLYGPHRADLDIHLEGRPVRHFLSRGQQKLLICAMILAQGSLLTKNANKGLIYLVDDLPAELDLQSKMKLLSLLSKQQTQIFITAIESETICDLVSDKFEVPMKVFHVEHGSVEQRTE